MCKYKLIFFTSLVLLIIIADVKASTMLSIQEIEIYTNPGSSVYLSGSYQGQSDNNGYIILRIDRNVQPEVQFVQMRISNSGFKSMERTINLDAENTLNYDITLSSITSPTGYQNQWRLFLILGVLLLVLLFIRAKNVFPLVKSDQGSDSGSSQKLNVTEPTRYLKKSNITEDSSIKELVNTPDDGKQNASRYDNLIRDETVDKYTIINKIAKGGVATLYEARDGNGKTVALKIMTEFLHDDDMVNKFIGEGWALQQIKKNFPEAPVITVYDYGRVDGEQNGVPFIEMELVNGQPLAFFIKNNVLTDEQKIALLTQLVLAIDAAHKCKVLHRDISPDNILVKDSANLEIRLIDFGVARHEVYWLKGTSVGAAFGKPEYMAPEQIEGGELDFRCDYYSLGILIYALFTGAPPFKENVMYKVFDQHINSEIPEMPENVPDNIQKLTKWLLAKKPDQRPENVQQIFKLLI